MISTIIETARAKLGIPASVPFERYNSILDLFDEALRRFPQQAAFTSLDHTLTFSELDRLSRNFAAFLQNHPQLQPGDRIALQLPNLIQYPVALFGALRAGLVIVNTNPMYRPEEIEHQLNDAGAKALVVLTNVVASAAAVIERTPVELVILTDLADLHPPFSRHVINFVARYIKRMVPAIDLPSAI